MAEDSNPSRRLAMGTAGAGLTASGCGAAVPGSVPNAAPFVDPKTKYPRPPFPRQEQPWPGLASQMTPRPDHGEASYRGSGRLKGRRALIVSATVPHKPRSTFARLPIRSALLSI